jgi:HK97 family phage portal protein
MQVNIFKDLIAEETRIAQAVQAERRSSLENPQTPLSYPAEWLLDIFNGGRTDSGIRVSEMTAFQVGTFCTCVDLISSSVAALPIHVYERKLTQYGRAVHTVAYNHPDYDIVHSEPNAEMTRHVFLKTFMVHALAWTNAYAEIQRDAGGNVVALWPRNPAQTSPRRFAVPIFCPANAFRPYPVTVQPGELVFLSNDRDEGAALSDVVGSKAGAGYSRIILATDMIHVPGLSFDGRIGASITWLAREALGQALAMVKFSSKYFANFAKPGGILEVPQQSPQDREQTKRSWMEAQGGENSNRIAVMPPGVKWTPMSNNPQEAQSVEGRAYVRTEISALFHVPSRMVGDSSHASRGTTEQENQEYLSYTLSPWLNAIKQEFKRKLFPHPNVGSRPKNPFFVDFDTSELIRASAVDRTTFYNGGKVNGYLNTNMILGMEKMNPIDEPWAEEFWKPVNMASADTPAGITTAHNQPESGTSDTTGDNIEVKDTK